MLTECPECRIQFGPSLRFCPQCGEHEAKLEHRIKYLQTKAEELLEAGVSYADVANFLVEEGMESSAANELAGQCQRTVSTDANRSGITSILVGFGLMVISLFIGAITPFWGICALGAVAGFSQLCLGIKLLLWSRERRVIDRQ